MWKLLMSPGARSLLNQAGRGSRHERLKLGAFTGLGLLFWAGLFVFCVWVLGQFLAVEVFGIYLVKKLLSMLLLALFSLLCFSNLVGALSAYFLADDLPLLQSLPLSLRQFHQARFSQTFVTSSSMAGLFGLPVLLAYGIVFHAPPLYYLAMFVYLFAFLMVPTGVGVGLATLLVSVFPARRTRDLIMVVSFVFVVGLLLFLRFLQPEKLVNANDFSDMLAFLGQLQSPTAPWAPSAWGVEVLSTLATGQIGEAPYYLGLTVLTGTVSLILSGWIVEALYPRAYTRAQEGSGSDQITAGWIDALLHLLTRPLPRAMQALVVKDLKSFFRDSQEWPQLLMVLALMSIYLYSIKVLPLDGPMITWNVHNFIAFLNLGMVGFVMSAIAVRFLFTSVSVEGRAFWMLQAAPLSPLRFLMAKYVAGLPLLLGVGLVLVSFSNWMLGTHEVIAVMGTLTVTALALSLTGLGVGMGALYPNFKAEHVAKIASGPGGILFMIVSQIFVAVVIVGEAVPTWLLLRALRQERDLAPWELAVSGGLLVLTLVPLALGAIVPMRRGARQLAGG